MPHKQRPGRIPEVQKRDSTEVQNTEVQKRDSTEVQNTEAQKLDSTEAPKRGSAQITRSPGVLGYSIYRTVRNIIKAAAWLLVAIFAWLKLNGIEIAPIAKSIPAGIVFKFSLALYYTCWAVGTARDTDIQEKVYVSQPNEGKLPISGFVWLLLIISLFYLLCWVDSYRKFSVLLSVFFVINIVTWQYLIRKILPAVVGQSKLVFADQPLRLEKVNLIYDRYLCGRWQWLRFAAGAVALALLNLLSFTDLSTTAGKKFGIISKDLVSSIAVLIFVILMEGWIWAIRFKVSTSLMLLDYLDERYGDKI